MIYEGTAEEYAQTISHYVEIPLLQDTDNIGLICNQAITAYIDRRLALFFHTHNMTPVDSKMSDFNPEHFKEQVQMSITDTVLDHLKQIIRLKKLELVI